MPVINFDFSDYHRTIIGCHGASAEQAERLVSGEPFTKSDCENEWLGDGVYFWEHAPKRVWWWAREVRKHKQPAVVGAMLRLGNCLDLLDSDNVRILKLFFAKVVKRFEQSGKVLPKNHRRHKKLDCAIFNMLYKIADSTKRPIDSVRVVYVPTDNKK